VGKWLFQIPKVPRLQTEATVLAIPPQRRSSAARPGPFDHHKPWRSLLEFLDRAVHRHRALQIRREKAKNQPQQVFSYQVRRYAIPRAALRRGLVQV
jgi:hypothetical protein